MPALFKNNATATLAASINTTATTIVLSSGLGSSFPQPVGSSFFYGTLFDSVGNYEIVKCTARTVDSLTVIRGQDGTNPLAFISGDGFAVRPVAAIFNNLVQLDGTQEITGVKTFSSGLVGNLTGNVVGNLTGNVTGSLATTNFTITELGGRLVFKYGANVIASIDSTGNLTSATNITAYGTP